MGDWGTRGLGEWGTMGLGDWEIGGLWIVDLDTGGQVTVD